MKGQNVASFEAFTETVLPTLTERQKQVLMLFKTNGEMCGHDVAKKLDVAINITSGRLTELTKEGLIMQTQLKLTSYSRTRLNFYKITELGREVLSPRQISLF